MANPYKYTKAEVKDLLEEWREGHITWALDDFIIWETKFTPEDYERWKRTGEVPHG